MSGVSLATTVYPCLARYAIQFLQHPQLGSLYTVMVGFFAGGMDDQFVRQRS